MAGKTKINGTEYTIKGGKCKVNSTAYSIKQGKTKIEGTSKTIAFSRLPSGYQEVEWISGDGTPWIDTAVLNRATLTKAEFVFAVNSIVHDKFIFGIQHQPGTMFAGIQSGQIAVWGASETINNVKCGTCDTSKHTITYLPYSIQYDGVTKATSSTTNFADDTYTMYLWGKNSEAGSSYRQGANCKIYSMVFENATEPTYARNLVPCYCTTTVTGYKGSTAVSCASGTIGMYDLVNDRFYVNSGGGTFSKGADV